MRVRPSLSKSVDSAASPATLFLSFSEPNGASCVSFPRFAGGTSRVSPARDPMAPPVSPPRDPAVPPVNAPQDPAAPPAPPSRGTAMPPVTRYQDPAAAPAPALLRRAVEPRFSD